MPSELYPFAVINYSNYPMSYQVIARKWRPQTFEEVTGQEHITQTLRNAIEFDRLHHAYLFSGARGVGKTTTARLLAKALNCHKSDKPTVNACRVDAEDICPSCKEIGESRSMDVFEFDAASNTQVDKIREIILEGINIAPARDRYKMFIIDEVHMLSTSSFNALLKTVEEPPPNVVFIMATTELHKVPDTIASRCQEFQFRTISQTKIQERLRLIADAEGVKIEDAALREIARSGEGSMRDAQSNFDQVISFSGEKITVPDVLSALGMAGTEMIDKAITAVAQQNSRAMLDIVADLTARGQDLRNFCRDMMAGVRDLSVYKLAGSGDLTESSPFGADELKRLAEPFSVPDLVRVFNSLGETESKLKEATQSRYTLELGLVKLVEMRRLAPIESILERLAALDGNFAAVPQAPTKPAVVAPAASVPVEPITSAPSQIIEPIVPSPELEKKTLKSAEPPENDWPERDLESLEPPEQLFDAPPDYPAEVPVEEPAEFSGSVPAFVDLGFVATTPLKLSQITSEDLEHIEDAKLDDAYELALECTGEVLMPIKNAAELVKELNPEPVTASSNGSGTAARPARDVSAFAAPSREIDNLEVQILELSAEPTDAELIAHYRSRPEIRAIMRAFRAEVVSVEPDPENGTSNALSA